MFRRERLRYRNLACKTKRTQESSPTLSRNPAMVFEARRARARSLDVSAAGEAAARANGIRTNPAASGESPHAWAAKRTQARSIRCYLNGLLHPATSYDEF